MSSITQASGKRRIMARANAGETGTTNTATGPTPNTAKRPARGRNITSSSGAIVGLAAAAALVVGFGGVAGGAVVSAFSHEEHGTSQMGPGGGLNGMGPGNGQNGQGGMGPMSGADSQGSSGSDSGDSGSGSSSSYSGNASSDDTIAS